MNKNFLLMLVVAVVGIATFVFTGFIGGLATAVCAVGFCMQMFHAPKIFSISFVIVGFLGMIYGLYQMIMHFAGALM